MRPEMLDSILKHDQQLFLFLNGMGTASWDGFWMGLSNKWVSIPLYLLLLIITYRTMGLKNTLILLVGVGLLVTTTDQLANFFKYGIQRLRPCHESILQGSVRLVKGYCGGQYGFYSAHSSNTMAVAVFFTTLLGRRYLFLGIFLILWALAVGYSRIYLGVHYPLDVLSGALAGLFLGALFARLYSLAVKKFSP